MDRLDERLRTLRDMVRLRPDGCELEPYVGAIDEARRELAELQHELNATGQELAELRDLAAGSYTVGWTWRDGELVPDEYVLTDEDGDPVDFAVDASGLVRAVLERQAGVWVRAAELTPAAVPLEQLLAMVPKQWELSAYQGDEGDCYASWIHEDCEQRVGGEGRSTAAAIRAATIALLRLERRCETCAHWGTEEESGRVRSCRRHPLHYARTADSSCLDSGDWEPLASEPEPSDDGPTESQISRARRVAADTEGTPESTRRLAVAWLAQHEPKPGDGEGGQ